MGWEIFPTALLNLPQNLVICIKRVTSTTLLKLSQYWAVCIENILLIKNVNEIPKIEVFIGSFLNFTIMVLLGVSQIMITYTKIKILSNLINNTIS